MSVSPTRIERKDRTRQTLLVAAAETFAARGWEATMIADIARAAGVAHGTFYVHFADKTAIADALLGAFNRRLAIRLAAAASSTADRESQVRAIARAFLAVLAAERTFVTWNEQRIASGMPRSAVVEGINPEARELLEGWLHSEGIEGERARLLALGLLALWIRVGLAARDPGSAEELLVAATLGAIGGVQ